MTTGWICPRCETVHAPSVTQCGCRPVPLFGCTPTMYIPPLATSYSCRHAQNSPLPCAECGMPGSLTSGGS